MVRAHCSCLLYSWMLLCRILFEDYVDISCLLSLLQNYSLTFFSVDISFLFGPSATGLSYSQPAFSCQVVLSFSLKANIRHIQLFIHHCIMRGLDLWCVWFVQGIRTDLPKVLFLSLNNRGPQRQGSISREIWVEAFVQRLSVTWTFRSHPGWDVSVLQHTHTNAVKCNAWWDTSYLNSRKNFTQGEHFNSLHTEPGWE